MGFHCGTVIDVRAMLNRGFMTDDMDLELLHFALEDVARARRDIQDEKTGATGTFNKVLKELDEAEKKILDAIDELEYGKEQPGLFDEKKEEAGCRPKSNIPGVCWCYAMSNWFRKGA